MRDKLPAHEYLDQNKIPYQRREFPSSTEKGAAQVAEALGYKPSQMVKTLVFESDKGERVLIMVGGDRNAVSGYLKKAIGSRNIKLASLEAVKETTGYEVGSGASASGDIVPFMTVRLERASYTVSEGVGSFSFNVIARAEDGAAAPSSAFTVAISTPSDTPTTGRGYSFLSTMETFQLGICRRTARPGRRRRRSP